MLLRDNYALHRKWWDRDWRPSFGDDLWVEWDYILAEVLQIIEDYTDSTSGQYFPYDQSDEVDWDIESTFSSSAAAMERKQKERGELKPGERLYAVPVFRNPDNKPTLATWFADIASGSKERIPEEHQGARPPTADEMAALLSNSQ
jgi:hypothetical protein